MQTTRHGDPIASHNHQLEGVPQRLHPASALLAAEHRLPIARATIIEAPWLV
eukprot:COSAG01_NODE_28813_length_652_cov_0.882459_1_plen_51_part_01